MSYPTAEKLDRHLLAISAVVVLGAIMSILDVTIVNVAIKTLAVDLNSPLTTVQWVATGYMLALAAVIPLTGWASERFGTKQLWMTSLVLFVGGSMLCGVAQNVGQLIVFRVLQGIGGGMIMPAGMTLLTQAAGPQRMGRVMGMIGVPMLLGPVLGPVIGGALVDSASWRWIFYVNVPVGMIALPLAWKVLDRDHGHTHTSLDILGVLLISPGLALFVYGLQKVANASGFHGVGAVAPLVAGLVLIAAFCIHALRAERPLLDLRLFRERAFSASAATTFLFGSSFFGSMILLPLYEQTVRGVSALDAGLLLAPQGLGAAVMMPIAGKLTDKRGPRGLVVAGLLICVAGSLVWSNLGVHTSQLGLGIALFVRGMGIGAVMMPAMSAAYRRLDHQAVPRATSTLNVLQRVGGSIGATILTVILSQQLPVGPGDPAARAGRLPAAAREQMLGAAAQAYGHTIFWSVVLLALALPAALLLPKGAPPRPAAPGQSPEARGEPIAEPIL